MTEMILTVNQLTQQFKTKKALDGVSISIEKGTIYGLVGENGAGKSTLLKILSNALPIQEGSYDASYFGSNQDYLKKTAFLIEDAPFFSSMTGYENLRFFLEMKGIAIDDDTKVWIHEFEMDDAMNKKVKTYSTGMRQRLALLLAFCSKPEFMVLDEPLNGLDPSGIIFLRNALLKLRDEFHTTILISSHILSELAMIVDKVGFLHHGHLLQEISIDEIKNNCMAYLSIKPRTSDYAEVLDYLTNSLHVENLEEVKGKHIYIYDEIDDLDLQRQLAKKDIFLLECEHTNKNLENYYMDLLKEADHELL